MIPQSFIKIVTQSAFVPKKLFGGWSVGGNSLDEMWFFNIIENNYTVAEMWFNKEFMEVPASADGKTFFCENIKCSINFPTLVLYFLNLRRRVQLPVHNIAQIFVLLNNRESFKHSANQLVIFQKYDTWFRAIQLHLVTQAPFFDSMNNPFQLFLRKKDDSGIISIRQNIFTVSAFSPFLQKIINENIK